MEYRAAFFSGIPLYSIYIYLPQRFQIVSGLSPLNSGIHLLLVPLVCFTATGIGSGLSFITNISYPLLVVALALQCLSLGLMTTLPSTASIPASLYGYETILGFGFGLALPTVSTIARMELTHFDHCESDDSKITITFQLSLDSRQYGRHIISPVSWRHYRHRHWQHRPLLPRLEPPQSHSQPSRSPACHSHPRENTDLDA